MRKDQEQIKAELMCRRDEYFRQKKLRKRRALIAIVPSVCCLLLICAFAIPQLQLKIGSGESSKTEAIIPSSNAAILSIDIAGQPYGSKHYTDAQKIERLMACLKEYPCRETNAIENESAPNPQEAYATVTYADGRKYIYSLSPQTSDGANNKPENGAAQSLKNLLDSLPPDP